MFGGVIKDDSMVLHDSVLESSSAYAPLSLFSRGESERKELGERRERREASFSKRERLPGRLRRTSWELGVDIVGVDIVDNVGSLPALEVHAAEANPSAKDLIPAS